MRDYEEKILNFLSNTTEPTDVEKIRKACRIGNWNTALKHCLELLIQGRILGQKTSKGWIFWSFTKKRVRSRKMSMLSKSKRISTGDQP